VPQWLDVSVPERSAVTRHSYGALQLFVASVRDIRRAIATLGKVYSRANFNKVSKFSTKIRIPLRNNCSAVTESVQILSSQSWRDKWRVSWFNDFIGN